MRLDVWPTEAAYRKLSMKDILVKLQNFSYEAKSSACRDCRKDYKRIVSEVRHSVLTYFDGLCLDCLDKTKAKTRDVDEDYWRHNDLGSNEWSKGCRIRHGEPTWYFSFLGRKEEKDSILRERGSRRFNDSFDDDGW